MLKLSHLRFEILKDVIVRDFSLELKTGEIKTLFGPSGCGKTTVLRLISGLEKPQSGEIHNMFRKTGFLFQENRLLNNLSAVENIAIFMAQADYAQIYESAAKIGLSKSDLNKYPTELSGGMAKRVAFLRLLLSGCDFALLDEPFVGLDRDLRDILSAILSEKVQQKQLACLLVTHDRFEAARLSHEIIRLSPKEMEIGQIIKLEEELDKRNSQFEEKIVSEQFNETIYYE